MANLRAIKKRINSVQSTRQITRTMEMVSSAKIRRATERVAAATPYALAMEEMLASIAAGGGGTPHPLLEVHDEIDHVMVIAIASDRGLAGAFNSTVMKRAEKFIESFKELGTKVDIIACGKKAIAYCAYRNYEVLRSYKDLSADPTSEQAREIAEVCQELYVTGDLDEVYIIYNHARNAADQDLYIDKILPIQADKGIRFSRADLDEEAAEELERQERENAERIAEERKTAKAGFEFEPDSDAVLNSLLPGYLETTIYHALLDSAAAEQGARRKAMKAATDNATEMIETLTRVYNRARQSSITTEITEIIGGAAAAEEDA